MLRRILVPLDGSGIAEAALPVALGLARDVGAGVELVLVEPVDSADAPAAWEWVAKSPHAYLEKIAAEVCRVGVVPHLSTAVLSGEVAEELLEYAPKSGADLIVMSTHGRAPLRRLWIGSVTDRLAREAAVPVLAVHPMGVPIEVELRAAPPVREVFVPLDGSDLATQALPGVTGLLGGGVSLTLFRVVAPADQIISPYLPDVARESHEIQVLRKERAARELEETADRLRERGFVTRTRLVVERSPARAILREVSGGDYGLIAMSTHGRSGLSRALLGSVTEKLLREVHVPVLVFRPREAGASPSDVESSATARSGHTPPDTVDLAAAGRANPSVGIP